MKVKWAGTNKWGFGEVKIEDGSQWGKKYNTGTKSAPPCKAGDEIEGDMSKDAKGYDVIKNIKVLSSGHAAPTSSGVSTGIQGRNRPHDQITRTEALKLAVEMEHSTSEVISTANLFEAFINGGIEDDTVQHRLLTSSDGSPLDGEDDLPC